MSDMPTCSRCPAWLFSRESITTGLCHGCRSGPPEMRITEPPPATTQPDLNSKGAT
ncbi:unnamed protein product [Gemmata massiliana]|uniref:Uncharacterized protein n=1 Tax=Gemmata massiliana TaxID=1210884 RepID=A0A6P2DD11_9BACT|nr:hypothetical protein [Gemmata massiliana]VTR99186.1 unnamed protein product [Gemmata massiliana]